MDLTIDQLAQRVAMTARNIREWQTLGLVPPPEKRGRVGIYSDEHIAIINHVKNLKSQGFPLDVIRRVIDSGSGSEDSVRKMVTEALDSSSKNFHKIARGLRVGCRGTAGDRPGVRSFRWWSAGWRRPEPAGCRRRAAHADETPRPGALR